MSSGREEILSAIEGKKERDVQKHFSPAGDIAGWRHIVEWRENAGCPVATSCRGAGGEEMGGIGAIEERDNNFRFRRIVLDGGEMPRCAGSDGAQVHIAGGSLPEVGM